MWDEKIEPLTDFKVNITSLSQLNYAHTHHILHRNLKNKVI